MKRKQALLESNLSGINLMSDENVSSRGFFRKSPLDIFRTPHAFKNSSDILFVILFMNI